MGEPLKFDYYYGIEAEQFSFYRVPRLLIKDERFKGLSSDAKLLYGLMLDRMSLSMKNGWLDDENRAYIIYTVDNMMEDLGCARATCVKVIKELDSDNGIGLIEKKRRGLGKPDIIYVKNFAAVSDKKPEETAANADKTTEVQNLNFKKFNNYTSGSSETESQEVQDLDLQKFRKQTSRNSETELAEVQKPDANYTNYNQTEKNYTDMSYTNPINQSTGKADVIDETSAYMALIRDNLEYEHHMKYDQHGDRELYEEIYETVCDVVCVKRRTIRINGEDYPYELVKSRFLKLNSGHVEYVMGCMRETVTKITNIRAYLITALYNAPSTMSHYLEKEGIPVSRENYTLVYTGELTEGMSLEDIYTKFNIDHPADFTGHSLSVSDVVVLHQDGENTSHYVDSVGYREIPEFTKELSVSAEVSAEKAPVMEETAEIPEGAAEEHTEAEPDNDKVSYYVIEDLSTWAENSPDKSRLERFDSLPEAVAKFTEYRGKDMEEKLDMARATFGFNVNGSEFDLLHVRNHENCLSLDFTHSRAAGESSRFMDDLQVLFDEVGFDKVRVHREMSPEEIKDFVKQRFEYQLKSSGLDDISLYMDRFDALYGQGKMEHLMPTANQKHIVEDVPFIEWENPYIDTSSHTTDRTETELAFQFADRYFSIQEASEGYDYTIYDMDYRELDGGVYDNPDITIRQALDEIVTDLKEPTHRSELEGSIRTDDELIPIDYDGLMEKAEQAAKEHLEERIRTEVPEAVESKVIADFKAKTEELFNGINGQTQEDIELNVYAYLQSKIDEYGMDIELVDMAVSGSRCRGLEGAGSDLDVVVEYRGGENEDALFNAFNEDGFTIGGVKVDINPITEGKTGTLGEYLPGVEAYLEEKRAAMQEKGAEQIKEEKQTVVTLTVAECGEFHNFGEYHENIAGVEEAIAIFNQIPPERMNGIPSIGINIHTEGTQSYEDTQMDIISGRVADLEILDYVPDITDNPKAVEVIAELIDKLPDIEVRGSLEKWQAAFLAAEIDQLSYDYDTYQYNHTVEDREAQIANITEDIRSGNTGYLNDFLNALISDSIREGMTDIVGKGTELDDSEGIQTARKAKELLDRLAEYKPIAKVEELEECNYNMIDNVLNNEKPKEEKQTGRISIKEKLAEKKAVIEQRDKAGKDVPEKGTEKKSGREI